MGYSQNSSKNHNRNPFEIPGFWLLPENQYWIRPGYNASLKAKIIYDKFIQEESELYSRSVRANLI